MSDNVPITAGAGTTVSTEEVTTLNGAGSQPPQHVQRMLLALVSGATGTDISASNPLPVGDAGGSLTVDDGGGSLTVDGSVAVTAALPAGTNNIGDVDVLTLPALPAGANEIGAVNHARLNGTTIDVDSGNKSAGTQRVVLATDQPVLSSALRMTVETRTNNGSLISRLLAAASTNATSVKASAGQVYGWYLFNAATSTRYLKLYNKASAPTVGTDTPFMTIPIPAGGAANVEFTCGIAFGTGIAFALTTGIADADTGALAASDVVVNLLYR